MPKFQRGRDLKKWKSNRAEAAQGKLRIVGGKYRGRQIQYSGDPTTRPMKDHTREAIFNLVGGWVEGKTCFDLFAGTGAIGIEAMSRGANKAYFVERHIPTLRLIRENVRSTDPEMNVQIDGSDSFFWVRQFVAENHAMDRPWVVFCCPPYALFEENPEAMIELIDQMKSKAPDTSLIVVESGESFDVEQLPEADQWDHRQYTPAIVSVFKKNF